MTTFVEIAVNLPQVAGVFHYHLPPELEGRLEVGYLVTAPFGNQTVQGVLLRFIDTPEVEQTRPLMALVDEAAVLTPAQIALARVISEQTLAPLAACIALMLPTGVSQRADTLYSLLEPLESLSQELELSETQERILAALHKRGPLRGRQLERALPRRNWRPAARDLVKKGLIASRPVLPEPSVRPKYIRTAQLAAPPEEIRNELDDLGRTQLTRSRRRRLMEALLAEPGPVNVSWVYAQAGVDKAKGLQDLRVLDRMGLLMLREEEVLRDPLAGLEYDPSVAPQLTSHQQAAWDQIAQGLGAAGAGEAVPPYLLHGVTGSGKTELYLRAVAAALEAGRQAIVLVPEIALTPQTVQRFMGRFPGRVGLLHSRLSPGERYDTWRRARAGRLPIIVGPRSALFAPLPQLGLIVVDESHDDSYYQFSQPPYYHARTVAVEYARLTGALCILGSATPDLSSYYRAKQGRWRLLELPARILAHRDTLHAQTKRLKVQARYQSGEGQVQTMELPPVQVVDMRAELKAGNRSIFSAALQTALAEVLDAGQQAILFLNRRGSATYVFCRDCGYVLRSPRSDVPLIYHADSKLLLDHHTGYSRKMPAKCPNCGSQRIRQYGAGTERVEAEVQALFPAARTLRWDYDTTRRKGAHEVILSHFANQRADILVGTQMLAKGLDLPLVTLVGVVLADVGLHLPDYRAGERVFQVLAQVSGRAGRGPLGGQVITQSFHPDHYVIQAAAAHDYAGFYEQELTFRRQLGYPPFTQLLRLEYRHTQADKAEKEAKLMAARLRTWLRKEERRATELIGPAPCFYAKLDGEYRWQIILRGPEPASLLRGRKLGDWRVEVNPQALL